MLHCQECGWNQAISLDKWIFLRKFARATNSVENFSVTENIFKIHLGTYRMKLMKNPTVYYLDLYKGLLPTIISL